ncbi:MAG TPA: O-antigen ligase family protein, partial [Acetobacteraceae bacterium]|nr:O-antigen ligase family protein [Acetobacteraceae bacterium]
MTALAGLSGAMAAVLQGSGALKTMGPALPLDLTALALLLVLAPLPLLVQAPWRVSRGIAVPLAAAALLPLWMAIAGGWSASRTVSAQRLADLVLLGPAMLAAGLVLGAHPVARRWLAGATLGVGGLLLLGLAWPPAFPPPGRETLNYQVAGLALAMAATLAALRAVEAAGPARMAAWLGAACLLTLGAMLPGGRMGLLTLVLCVLVLPALRLAADGRRGAALLWAGAVLGAAALPLLAGDALGHRALRTVQRLTELGSGLQVRGQLWREALLLGGASMPWGLGTGGFSIAAGFGENRGLYPHNHALEALAEGGLPGLLLWLLAFGGGIAVLLGRARAVEPGRAARIAAIVLPIALSCMVSSDLGNRMAWFA